MNIFLRELRAYRKSVLIWCGIMLLFIVVGFSKFSAYYNNPEMLELINDFPKAMVETFNLKAFNLTTITGFYGVMFAYFSLMLSIAAAMWGSDIISKEERDKTVEFSLTLPVTRTWLLTAKTLAAVVNCIVLLLVTGIITVAMAQQYEPDDRFYRFVAISMLALFIVQMIFLAVGILLGCAMKQYKRAGSAAVSLLLVTYFLSIIAGLNKNLEFLKYVSPFKYFNPVTLLNESRVDIGFIGLSVVIIVASMARAYMSYAKRDLYI
jgi:ABC-2 type transport system permease protein